RCGGREEERLGIDRERAPDDDERREVRPPERAAHAEPGALRRLRRAGFSDPPHPVLRGSDAAPTAGPAPRREARGARRQADLEVLAMARALGTGGREPALPLPDAAPVGGGARR